MLRTDKVLDHLVFLCLAVLHQTICFIFWWRYIWIALGGIITSSLNWIWPYDMHMTQMYQSTPLTASRSVDLLLWMWELQLCCTAALSLGWTAVFCWVKLCFFKQSSTIFLNFVNVISNHFVLHIHYWLQEPLCKATLNPLSHMDWGTVRECLVNPVLQGDLQKCSGLWLVMLFKKFL